jgi:hypothetical protein
MLLPCVRLLSSMYNDGFQCCWELLSTSREKLTGLYKQDDPSTCAMLRYSAENTMQASKIVHLALPLKNISKSLKAAPWSLEAA